MYPHDTLLMAAPFKKFSSARRQGSSDVFLPVAHCPYLLLPAI
jgi:hypothetical protein